HLGRGRRLALLLLLPAVARHAALAAGLARFLAGPLVRCALLMRRLAALARDLPLLVPVHRCQATILFCHAIRPSHPCSEPLVLHPMFHGILLTSDPTRT